MPASAETETQGDQPASESGLGEPQILDFNTILSEAVLERFEEQVHRLARDHGYFYDKPDGNPYSPTRIYEMTQKIGVGALTSSGSVEVIVPQLELRHKRNADQIFAPQAIAREFGIKATRLKAIQKFLEDGTLSPQEAFKLAGNQDPKAALETHQDEWQAWVTSTREVQARQQPVVAGDRVSVGDVEIIMDEQEAQDRPSRKRASRLSRATAPIRRRVILAAVGGLTILGMLLSACSPRGGTGDIPTQPPSSTPAGELFTPDAPTAVSTATVKPTEPPTPAPFSGATEAAPTQSAVYGPPNLERSVRLAGSGGSGRNEILTKAGIDEATLVSYENAAYSWAANNGYTKNQVNIEYLFDGQSWNMVLREVSSGNYIWSEDGEGALMTYPTIIRVDAQGPHADPEMGARVLEGTKDAKAMLVNGFVVVVRGSVQIAGKTYYTEWFNTVTGEWQPIAEVQAAIVASAPEFTHGLAPDFESAIVVRESDIPAIIASLRAGPSLIDPGAQPTRFAGREGELSATPNGLTEQLNIPVGTGDLANVAVAATIRVDSMMGDSQGSKLILILEVKNDTSMGHESRGYIRVYIGGAVADQTVFPTDAATKLQVIRKTIGDGLIWQLLAGTKSSFYDGSFVKQLFNQKGSVTGTSLRDLLLKWKNEGVVPSELEDMLIPMSGVGS